MNRPSPIHLKRRPESGISLVFALLVLSIVTTMSVGLIFATESEVWTSQNYRKLAQTRYAAEAGAQWAANWLGSNYTAPTAGFGTYTLTTFPATYSSSPVVISSASSGISTNYSDSTMATSFSTAAATASSSYATATGISGISFQVSAQMVSITATSTYPVVRWKIISRGLISGITAAESDVTILAANSGSPLFNDAMFATASGCTSINMNNGATTNSYSSTTNPAPSSFASTGGNIGANGNILLVGATIHGNVSTGYAGTSSSSTCTSPYPGINQNNGGTFTGTQSVSTQTYATINPPNSTSTTTCAVSAACSGSYYSGTWTMPTGNYGNVSFGNGDTIQLVAGTYVLNSLSVQGGVTVKMPTTGQVIIYIQGTGVATPVNFANGTIANAGGVPSNLQIYYGGTGAVALGGGAAQYALIYAPNAPVTMNNGNAVYGAIVGNTINFAGGGTVHYDTASSSVSSVTRALKQEAFSWNSY